MASLDFRPQLPVQPVRFRDEHAAAADAVVEQRLRRSLAIVAEYPQTNVELPILVSLAHTFVVAASLGPKSLRHEQAVRQLIQRQLFEKIVMPLEHPRRLAFKLEVAKNKARIDR